MGKEEYNPITHHQKPKNKKPENAADWFRTHNVAQYLAKNPIAMYVSEKQAERLGIRRHGYPF